MKAYIWITCQILSSSPNAKKGRPLTGAERNLIAHLYKLGFTQTTIAKEVGVWPSTICRELRRGMVDQLNGATWEYYKTYSPQKAQCHADYMRTAHGPDLKIGSRADYLAALESYMGKKRWAFYK